VFHRTCLRNTCCIFLSRNVVSWCGHTSKLVLSEGFSGSTHDTCFLRNACGQGEDRCCAWEYILWSRKEGNSILHQRRCKKLALAAWFFLLILRWVTIVESAQIPYYTLLSWAPPIRHCPSQMSWNKVWSGNSFKYDCFECWRSCDQVIPNRLRSSLHKIWKIQYDNVFEEPFIVEEAKALLDKFQ